MKKKWDSLAGTACQFTPLKKDGVRYAYSSRCEKNGMLLETSSILIVDSDSSYRVDTETHTNTMVQKEELLARRVANCAQ